MFFSPPRRDDNVLPTFQGTLQIPEEILIHIFSYVQPSAQPFSNLCLVSKHFYSITSSDKYWENIWRTRFNTNKLTKNFRFAYIQIHQVKEIQHRYNMVKEARVAVLGAGNIGKTALTLRICSNVYVEDYDPTM
jgi:hypothetical protein